MALVTVATSAGGEVREEKPRLSIAVLGCDEALAREAQRIAAVELRAALVEAPPYEATTQVTATCAAEAADLRVLDPMTGKSLERSVALSQAAPTARARLLALAIAELVAASWSELESNPEPQAPPSAPLAPVGAREAARGVIAPFPIELAAVADTRLLASRDLLFGGGARAEFWVSPAFFLRFDGLAHYAEISRATGTIALTMPSLSGGFGASFGKASVRTDLSVGARAGYVWMSGVSSGETTSGSRQSGVWAGPELSLDCAPWPRARIHPLVSVSLGAHVIGVRGTVNHGRDVLATSIWSSVSVGAALR